MTTLLSLFAEDIYIKGKPLEIENITNVTNNVTTINAVIAGLMGGQPISEITPEPVMRDRPPTNTDDINENWDIGSIWVTAPTTASQSGAVEGIQSPRAYVCMDNTEINAKWSVISVEINDSGISQNSTYSSYKIADEFKNQINAFDGKMSAKANIIDVNTLLSGKASTSSLVVALNQKADKSDINALVNAVDGVEFSLGTVLTSSQLNATNLASYKLTQTSNGRNIISLIDANKTDIASNVSDLNTYKTSIASNLNNMIGLITQIRLTLTKRILWH